MANVTQATSPVGAVIVLRVVDFFYDVSARIQAWNEARVTRNALLDLSDAQLEDIGLTRGDVKEL